MSSTEIDDERLYWIVRKALRDALRDVVEAVLTVLITVLLIIVGIGFIVRGISVEAGPVGWLTVVFGGTVVLAALVYVLREFRLLPFTDG